MLQRVAGPRVKDGQHFITCPGGWVQAKHTKHPVRHREVVVVPANHDPLNLYGVMDAWCTRRGSPSESKLYCHRAWLHRHGEAIALRLHDTSILMCWPNGDVRVSTGGHGGNTGWPTVTTARYLDEFLPRGWGISRTETPWHPKTWTVISPNVEFVFREGMIFNLYTEEVVAPGLEGPVCSWPKGYHRDPGWHHYYA